MGENKHLNNSKLKKVIDNTGVSYFNASKVLTLANGDDDVAIEFIIMKNQAVSRTGWNDQDYIRGAKLRVENRLLESRLSIADIKRLRNELAVGLPDAKRALMFANNDYEVAKEFLILIGRAVSIRKKVDGQMVPLEAEDYLEMAIRKVRGSK